MARAGFTQSWVVYHATWRDLRGPPPLIEWDMGETSQGSELSARKGGVQDTFQAVELIAASHLPHNATGDVKITKVSTMYADVIPNLNLGFHVFNVGFHTFRIFNVRFHVL